MGFEEAVNQLVFLSFRNSLENRIDHLFSHWAAWSNKLWPGWDSGYVTKRNAVQKLGTTLQRLGKRKVIKLLKDILAKVCWGRKLLLCSTILTVRGQATGLGWAFPHQAETQHLEDELGENFQQPRWHSRDTTIERDTRTRRLRKYFPPTILETLGNRP